MISRLIWTTWTPMSAGRERQLNLITHSLTHSINIARDRGRVWTTPVMQNNIRHFCTSKPYQNGQEDIFMKDNLHFYQHLTSQWSDNCEVITWMVISNSLDIDFIHGDIHNRSCKKLRSQPKFIQYILHLNSISHQQRLEKVQQFCVGCTNF